MNSQQSTLPVHLKPEFLSYVDNTIDHMKAFPRFAGKSELQIIQELPGLHQEALRRSGYYSVFVDFEPRRRGLRGEWITANEAGVPSETQSQFANKIQESTPHEEVRWDRQTTAREAEFLYDLNEGDWADLAIRNRFTHFNYWVFWRAKNPTNEMRKFFDLLYRVYNIPLESL
ncbi:hypothetical protein F5878DRAFT_607777 [Lentinula raphanica]|uniref:Uncharacterized protein n=1 Tax=Lentinula raphanica TaxID=153919 RepID=A0AA38UIR1_9AGAR|nr:hypothetical protein F5878DRAFT_607777 [Lentinula raphanica]